MQDNTITICYSVDYHVLWVHIIVNGVVTFEETPVSLITPKFIETIKKSHLNIKWETFKHEE